MGKDTDVANINVLNDPNELREKARSADTQPSRCCVAKGSILDANPGVICLLRGRVSHPADIWGTPSGAGKRVPDSSSARLLGSPVESRQGRAPQNGGLIGRAASGDYQRYQD